MATTLEQVLAELNPYYSKSEELLNTQLAGLPAQGEAEVAGLDAKLKRANSNILDSARSRGLGWSGPTLAEQQEYAATDYAPAVAKVKQTQESSRMGILESLNSLGRDKRSQAQSIFDSYENRRLQEEQLAEQRRQFEENLKLQREQAAQAARAASAASAGSYLGGGGSSAAAGAPGSNQKGVMAYSPDQGFQFRDESGLPITAYQFAIKNGTPFVNLLQKMAGAGDKAARLMLADTRAIGGPGNIKDMNYARSKYGNLVR